MRKLLLATTMVLVFGPAVWAGGDKTALPFVDTSSIAGGANGFDNGTSAGQLKQGGCTLSIGVKKLNLGTGPADGDVVICIAGADVKSTGLPAGGAGNTVVMTAAAKKGAFKIKAVLGSIDVAGNHCGSTQSVSFNSKTTCYMKDGTYDPATACAAVPGIWLPNPTAGTNLVGICQGTTLGARIGAPASGVIAETGATILLGAK